MPDFNYVDLIILGILFLSALAGVMRGFTREVLGIIGWLGAIFVTFYALPHLRPFATPYIRDPFIADIAVALVVFIFILVLLNVISGHLSIRIKKSVLSGLDRTFGLAFGVVRGGLLLCLAYLIVALVWKPEKWPEAVQTARATPYIADGAHWLKQLVPEDALKNLGFNLIENPRKNQVIPTAEMLAMQLSRPQPGELTRYQNKREDKESYSNEEASSLDALVKKQG